MNRRREEKSREERHRQLLSRYTPHDQVLQPSLSNNPLQAPISKVGSHMLQAGGNRGPEPEQLLLTLSLAPSA